MPARLTALGAFTVALLIAAPAHADLTGHDCAVKKPVADGEVSASVFLPVAGGPEYPELRWKLAEQKTDHGRARLYVNFLAPAADAAPTTPWTIFLDAAVSVTPKTNADVILSIGEVSARQSFYRPSDFPYPGGPGAIAQMTIRDAAFLRALSNASSVHMVLRQTDGVVLDEADLALTGRPAALEALTAAWREVRALVPKASTVCQAVTIDE